MAEKPKLSIASIARYTKDEGLVVTADGTDYTLDWVGSMDISIEPGSVPEIVLRVVVPTLEVYIP